MNYLKAFTLIILPTILLCASDHTMDSSQVLLLLPWPRSVENGTISVPIPRPCDFTFELANATVDEASRKAFNAIFEHYIDLIFRKAKVICEEKGVYGNNAGNASKLVIYASNATFGVPTPDVSESYTLRLDSNSFELRADTFVGVVRGLETFSQVVYYDELTTAEPKYFIPQTPLVIDDSPAVKQRGLFIDATVNFLSKDRLFKVLDGMMSVKLNVLHILLASDHSFAYESRVFPNITFNGAYSEEEFYTHEDIAEIVAYAALRGVRIIPEISLPTHTRAITLDPNFTNLTACKTSQDAAPENVLLDPTKNGTFALAVGLLKELTSLFPDPYVYIGTFVDDSYCYDQKLQTNESAKVLYLRRLLNESAEVLRDKTKIVRTRDQSPLLKDDDSIVYHLMGSENVGSSWSAKNKVILTNTNANLGSGLGDRKGEIGPPLHSWRAIAGFSATQARREGVLGYHIDLEGDLVDDATIDFYLWPRTGTLAENLWSPVAKPYHYRRVGALEVRLNERGIKSQPTSCEWCQRHISDCFGPEA
eukprot:TRINITY_DN1026_c0_g2_i9.p1 TRINITY_DN1026_c0_g2~~TRINITY_DN1026_c0_g2_i9.p1  ORF type:complete len:536 (-),score=106.64 TRINITY_DN1026_c0_g2_i9:104-1711(-)